MSDEDPKTPPGNHMAQLMDDLDTIEKTNLAELTDTQRQIAKFLMRGFGAGAIAKVVGMSKGAVEYQMTLIRRKMETIGATISQDYVVGESLNVFSEVEQRGWELFTLAKDKGKLGDALKSLNVIMSARKNGIDFLQDVGLIRRAKVEHEHTVEVSPLVKEWAAGDAQRKMVIASIVDTQLEELQGPVPPQLEANNPVAEADILEGPVPPNDSDIPDEEV